MLALNGIYPFLMVFACVLAKDIPQSYIKK